jgi:hypothetical protein
LLYQSQFTADFSALALLCLGILADIRASLAAIAHERLVAREHGEQEHKRESELHHERAELEERATKQEPNAKQK